MITIKPPTKPSDLIELALADLRKVEADERYCVSMYMWHAVSDEKDICHVCMAGAVMAKSLGADPTVDASPSEFGDRWAKSLNALNEFRVGSIECGMSEMNIDRCSLGLPDYVDIPSYDSRDPEPFHRAMHDMILLLRNSGV